jgi:hypothetical protein
MKNIFNNIKKVIVPFMGMLMITSCGDENDFAPYATKDIQDNANVKFVHASVGPNGTNFTVNYFMGTDKISSVAPAASGAVAGIVFGGTVPSPINYALIKPGDQPLTVVVPEVPAAGTTAAIPARTVFTGNIVTEKGKFYTSFLVSTPPSVTPPVYSTLQLTDDLSPADLDPTKAYVRFINVISNTPATGYDLGIIKTRSDNGASVTVTEEIKTFRNVAFKGGDAKYTAIEAQVPTDARGYQLQVRAAGSPTNVPGTITGTTLANLANSGTGIFVPRAGRVYTLYCRGIAGGLPTAATNVPLVTYITNK